MEAILGSKRLKALCNSRWLCPLNDSFIDTLVNLVSSSYEDGPQPSAVRVCWAIMSNPVLAPVIARNTAHCLALAQGLASWILKGHRSDEDIELAQKVIRELEMSLRSQLDRKYGMNSVMEHLLLPMARLAAAFKEDENQNMKMLVINYRMTVTVNLFENELMQDYKMSLEALFTKESEAVIPKQIKTFFAALISAIENEPVEVASCMISDVFSQFIYKYQNQQKLHFQLLVVLCYLIGVSPSKSSGSHVVADSFAKLKIKPPDINQAKTERILLSLLEVVESKALDLSSKLGMDTLKAWLGKLVYKQLLHPQASASGFKCFSILIAILPQIVANMVIKKYNLLYASTEKEQTETSSTDPTCSKEAMYLAFEDLVCEILKVYDQLRDIPGLINGILQGITNKQSVLSGKAVVPESIIIYKGNLLIPPRFMMSFNKVISSLSHNQILLVWKSIHTFLTDTKPGLVNGSDKFGGCSEVRSAILWLYSCILMASPIMQAITVAGFAPSIADMMKRSALEVVKPFVESMLTLPHDNNLCSSVLVLCHSWGEVHMNLMSVDFGYSEVPEVPRIHSPKKSKPTDFSYLFPFISSDNWAQISARVANFGNKPTQLALVQLVIQKFSRAAAEHSSNLEKEGQSKKTQAKAMEGLAKYLVNALETWGAPITQMMTFHLTYILPFISEAHLPSMAKHLVSGIREDQEEWKVYVKSDHFLEASSLHPHVLLEIFSLLITLSGSGKRKHSESESEESTTKNYFTKLLKRLKEVCLKMSTLQFTMYEAEKWEILVRCGGPLKKLLGSGGSARCNRISSKEIAIMVDLISSLPLAHLREGSQALILMALFAILVQEVHFEREENILAILDAINISLCSPCKIEMLGIINVDSLLSWLVKKRLSLPVFVVPEHMLNLALPYMKFGRGKKFPRESSKNDEYKRSVAFDHLLITLLKVQTVEFDLGTLAEQITSMAATASDEEPFLHIAVMLMSACFKKKKEPFKSTLLSLSDWILKMHNSDLATTTPVTAACILTGHAVTVVTKMRHLMAKQKKRQWALKKKEKGEVEEPQEEEELPEEEPQEEEEPLDDEPPEEEGPSEGKPKEQEKPPEEVETQPQEPERWQKLLGCSLELASLCLTSGDEELKEYALTFLNVVSKYGATLKQHVPNLLFIVWKALSYPKCISDNTSILQGSNISLAPLFSSATPEEYGNLLQDLLKRTQGENLINAFMLWKIVINSKSNDHTKRLKSMAMENLVYILIDLVSAHSADKDSVSPILVPTLEHLKKVVSSSVKIGPHIRVLGLIPCTTIHLSTLPAEEFKKVFTATVDILNNFVVHRKVLISERIPTLLAAITHLTKSVIAQASQERNLTQDQIDIMVHCITLVERVVQELNHFTEKLRRVVHFTVGSIVKSLQQTTIYPAVKTILENIIYCLMDLSDTYCMQHLLVAMPPANTELLKHLHRNYHSFHRFHPFQKSGEKRF